MTAYLHRDRRHCRYCLRRLQWRINLLLSVLVLLFVLLPAAASAGPRCPAGYPRRISHGCQSPTGGVACDAGYEGRFRQVNGLWIGRCAAGPIVWGGQP